jgi:hypothetical protein
MDVGLGVRIVNVQIAPLMTHSTSRLPRGLPLAVLATAVLSIAVGYVNLWQGGTSVAASALVIGYVLLAPLAMVLGARSAAEEVDPPPYALAFAVGGVIWLLYLATLAPSTAMWDTSEYITAAKVLGIPHPPGNPLFVLIAHTFALIPVPLEYAARVNLLAATTSALSAVFWVLVAHRALRGWGLPRIPRAVIAALGAWIGATAFTVWNQSVVNEKVYTVAMLFVAAVAWAALRWDDAPRDSRRADLLIVLAAYLCGLGYANHPAGFLPIPAVGLFVLLRRPTTIFRWRLILAAAAATVIGMTPFAFQPIRAAHAPALNVGAPTACTNGPELGCTFSAETWKRLKSNIDREQYGGHSVAQRQAPITAQVGMWWLYFRWQWLRDFGGALTGLQSLLALTFLGLGVFGGVLQYRRDRVSFAFLGPLIGTLTPALIYYLNFKYGASQAPELGDSVTREVRDRDYFYLWSFATWGLWVALGLGGVWQWLAARVNGAASNAAQGFRVAAPVLLIAFVPLVANWNNASRRSHTFTREWAHDLLGSVEPNGILVTMGDNDSFPLWYAQHVEGIRPDVTLAITPYLGTDWFVRELTTRVPPAYTGPGIAAYEALSTTAPTTPVLRMTIAEADAIPQVTQLPRPQLFVKDSIQAMVPAGYFTRDQQVVLRMILDAFPARPVYFTYPNFARDLGLQDYIVQQGLAFRLLPTKASADSSLIPYRGGHFDLLRSRELWASYRGPAAFLAERQWVDVPSVNIPALYALSGELLAQASEMRGDSTTAKAVARDVEAIAQRTGLWR